MVLGRHAFGGKADKGGLVKNLSRSARVVLSAAVLLVGVMSAQVINLIPDTHKVVAKHGQLDNQMVSLGNRLIAHYKAAQEWEGINSENPEAVALREKIAREEKEFFAKQKEYKLLPPEKDIVKKCERECSDDEQASFLRAMKDFNSTVSEWEVQHDRYHALGY
jgi:hypothetical protein